MFRSFVAVMAVALALTACGGSDSKSGSADPSQQPTGHHLTFTTAGADPVVVNVGETKEVSIKAGTEFTIEAPEQVGWKYHWEPAGTDATANAKSMGGDTYTANITAPAAAQYAVSAKFSFSGDNWATIKINVTP